MQKVYIDGDDKYVGSVIAYGDSTDSKLYDSTTAATKKQITEEELVDAFKKGLLLIAVVGETTEYLKPISVSGNKAYTVGESSNTVAITEWSAKASE